MGERWEVLDRSRLKLAADGSAIDPWGRPYLMRVSGEKRLVVWSAGPDGVAGSRDDVPGDVGAD